MDPAVHRYILSGIFILAGLLHFIKPGFYLRILPDFLPAPLWLVYISGLAEILGGIGLLISNYRNAAAIGLILMLIVFFMVHIDMAWQEYRKEGPGLMFWLLNGRIALQFVLIWWVYKSAPGLH